MPDESISGSLGERLANIIAGSGSSGWHVIHNGNESGPFLLAELIEKAAAGHIEPDDLVKQAGGKWIKASTVSYFQEHFRLRQSKQAAIDKLGRFHGAWLSKKVFVVCCCVFIVCAASIVGAFFAGRRSSITVDSAPVAEKKITIEEKVEWFKGNAQHSISHDDFSKAMSKGPFYDVPDKDEVISAHQANREFSPIIPIIDSQLVSVCRYYPYETANGPAYRVNLLWGLSANQKRGSILWAKYFRAPN